jgi:hypothetical protein
MKATKSKLKPKQAGYELNMKTFKGASGVTYLVLRTHRGSFNVLVETNARQAALDCGSTIGPQRDHSSTLEILVDIRATFKLTHYRNFKLRHHPAGHHSLPAQVLPWSAGRVTGLPRAGAGVDRARKRPYFLCWASPLPQGAPRTRETTAPTGKVRPA